MNLIRVYVAGPYTAGNPDENVDNAIGEANRLMSLGYVPFIPHLTHFWDQRYPREYEEWLDWCLEWVKVCDCVLRLPGESRGADIETELAYGIDVPVFHSIEELHANFTEQL